MCERSHGGSSRVSWHLCPQGAGQKHQSESQANWVIGYIFHDALVDDFGGCFPVRVNLSSRRRGIRSPYFSALYLLATERNRKISSGTARFYTAASDS